MTLNQGHEAWVKTAKPIVEFPGNRSARKKLHNGFWREKKKLERWHSIKKSWRRVWRIFGVKDFFLFEFPAKKVTQTWPRFVGSHFFGCRTRKLKTSKQLIFWSRCNEQILNLAPISFLAWPLKLFFLQRPGVSQLPAARSEIWPRSSLEQFGSS